ncbi:tigger transposable element-derived protein 6-like [Acyrthosiphon pisum]|uniref:HTH CENPB-type domain-containing protein n=1 Tax=Acyrthosiphon pisum TaxID=7029 RepID=A0A8R2B764_ACYPI|nr:tigger transposable element-derived protein 6-like [Acyrthosiphon pisum]|eukprot:XP_008184662.1 PREDICTED: tigger transposable element-derived protein 6-like [Acyrthosiphon pisum]
MTTLKRKRLSLREKIDILDYRKNNGNVGIRVLAEKFQVGKTQIADIVSNTEEIYKAWVENGNEERKLTKLRKCEGSVIDKELLVWFSKTREKNLPVSGPTIQEKAKQLAEVHGLNDFKASNGWLEKFRKRHNISFKSICGEASAVDRIAVDDWKKKLPNIIDKYEKRDIFNADETGLFFRVLPNKTMAFKNETCNGGKVSKERLTVLLCCNIIGLNLYSLNVLSSLVRQNDRGLSKN